MLARVRSAAVLGIDAYLVDVETDIANGLPTFATVGLPQGAVKEGRERVYAATANSGYTFPLKRITGIEISRRSCQFSGLAISATDQAVERIESLWPGATVDAEGERHECISRSHAPLQQVSDDFGLARIERLASSRCQITLGGREGVVEWDQGELNDPRLMRQVQPNVNATYGAVS